MAGEVFDVSLWFNAGKEKMREQLEESDRNYGVGIRLGKNAIYFDPERASVELKFDDGTSGRALVTRDRSNHCTHLIHNSIGRWARNNGLWRKKLERRSVAFRMEVIEDQKVFSVYLV
jgi:hypothetical protein